MALAAVLLAGVPALAQGGPPPPALKSSTAMPNTLEIRFHNMPLKGVHADATQNALALDFLNGVDGSAFDRLSAAMPDWISMAYANYDSGVIRASRPVTFLTRDESDGFSLRMVAAAAPGDGGGAARTGGVARPGRWRPAAAAPPGPRRRRPTCFARYNAYGAMRGYDQLELAVNRGDPYWQRRLQPAPRSRAIPKPGWAANITAIIPAIR